MRSKEYADAYCMAPAPVLRIVLCGLLLDLLHPAAAHGWACPAPDVAAQAERAALIFLGTALEASRTRGPDLRTTTFRLERLYKGQVPAGTGIVVRTCIGDKCGGPFLKGQRYGVFASVTAAGIYCGVCGGTRAIQDGAPAAQALLAELAKLAGR